MIKVESKGILNTSLGMRAIVSTSPNTILKKGDLITDGNKAYRIINIMAPCLNGMTTWALGIEEYEG